MKLISDSPPNLSVTTTTTPPDPTEEFNALKRKLTQSGREALAHLCLEFKSSQETNEWATYMQKGAYTCKIKESSGYPALMVSTILPTSSSLQEIASVIESSPARTTCTIQTVLVTLICRG